MLSRQDLDIADGSSGGRSGRPWRALWSMGIAWSLGTLSTAPQAAHAASGPASVLLKLEGDYLGMVPVALDDGKSQLAVFGAGRDELSPTRLSRKRHIEWFDKSGSTLTKSPTMSLTEDVAAYDVCRLDPASPRETLLLIRGDGVYEAGRSQPLLKMPTLFPHARDDAVPRIRICFPLFKNEASALVVPRLAGVAVYRQTTPRVFVEHALIDVDAQLGLHWRALRGDELEKTQRINVRFEFPDVSVLDFNGDGLMDLCFSQPESLHCRLQNTLAGFTPPRETRHLFKLRTIEERQDTSLRLHSRLVDLNGDGRPDFVIAKNRWNVADMGTSLHIYLQKSDGGFAAQPDQIVDRDGYFSYQEYFDYDGDGLPDIIAPVASLGWTDLARIYLSRAADIEFVWFKNQGGKFDTKALTIHSFSFPVEFRNLQAILGALPLWDVRFKVAPKDATAGRMALFFPKKSSLDLRQIRTDGKAASSLWQTDARLGSETMAIDLDGDGFDEIVSAYPRDPVRSGAMLFINTPSP